MSAANEEDIVHAFLYISHGSNVSSINNYYPMETKFNSIIMHSKPFETIDGKELEQFMSNPCKIITGSCPYIPIEDTYGKRVFLPPLLFYNLRRDQDEKNMVAHYSGLYYMPLKMDENKKCILINHEIVYDHNGLLQKFGDNVPIAYSQIFKMVTDDAKIRKINLEDVVLSIFSCQSKIDTYDAKYDIKIKDLLPKRIEQMNQATIFKEGLKEGQFSLEKDKFISPTIITFDIDKLPKGWNTLAKIKHQGCALNVLSFFGIIEENEAREKVVCLSLKGTSIFKIVDYINAHSRKKGITRDGFVIIRYRFDVALNNVFQELFMNNYKHTNYAIIFKMYNEREYNGKENHRGHTVAIMNYQDNFHLFDPQAEITIKLVKDQPFSQQIKIVYQSKGMSDWNYIDIIFTVDSRDNFDQTRPVDEFNRFMINQKGNIIARTSDVTHGGLKKIKHRKTLLSSINKISINKISMNKKSIKNKKRSIKNNKKSINKISIKNKKRSMNKNKKRNSIGGGNEELDDFQRIMLEIDKRNNTKSVLMIETSKKVDEE
jgi:hypothetical protein